MDTFTLSNEDVARIRIALFAQIDFYEANNDINRADYYRSLAECLLCISRPIDGSREYAKVTITR